MSAVFFSFGFWGRGEDVCYCERETLPLLSVTDAFRCFLTFLLSDFCAPSFLFLPPSLAGPGRGGEVNIGMFNAPPFFIFILFYFILFFVLFFTFLERFFNQAKDCVSFFELLFLKPFEDKRRCWSTRILSFLFSVDSCRFFKRAYILFCFYRVLFFP